MRRTAQSSPRQSSTVCRFSDSGRPVDGRDARPDLRFDGTYAVSRMVAHRLPYGCDSAATE